MEEQSLELQTLFVAGQSLLQEQQFDFEEFQIQKMFPVERCLQMETAESVLAGILPMPGSLDLGMDFVEELQIPQFLQQREIALFEPTSK